MELARIERGISYDCRAKGTGHEIRPSARRRCRAWRFPPPLAPTIWTRRSRRRRSIPPTARPARRWCWRAAVSGASRRSFEHVKGVTKVVAGYSGGAAETATYPQVTTETTGHAESVQITFDPRMVSFGKLLQIYFSVAHDPTELEFPGPGPGHQLSLGDLLRQPGAGKNRPRLYRPAGRGACLRPAHRHQNRAAEGLLCRRGLSPGLSGP